MTHYRAQPEDDAVLIVLCAVRDGQFGKSALNEVIDLWVAGQIARTDLGAVGTLAEVRLYAEKMLRSGDGNTHIHGADLLGIIDHDAGGQ